MLQFITSLESKIPVAEQVRQVINGGCLWIQVDMPGASDEEFGKVVEEIKPLCLEKGAFLLFNDHAELAKNLDVGGVLLSKTGMLPSQARLLLGPAAVIGVTAETEEDIDAVQALDIDFVSFPAGIGNGKISELCRYMESKKLEMGRVASGDIPLDDVSALMQTGINGIAVSNPIASASDIKFATLQYLNASSL